MDQGYFDIMRSERNWIEDAALENGNYINTCCGCGEKFIGHKRRVICFECAYPKPTLNLSAMHIRIVFYGAALLLFLASGHYFGFREILPWLLWAIACVIAGELGAWFKRRKHRNDK